MVTLTWQTSTFDIFRLTLKMSENVVQCSNQKTGLYKGYLLLLLLGFALSGILRAL